jgi:hypothetical protein
MWTLILTIISAATFFGFVAYCWAKFGLLDCYSAYGPAWAKTPPFSWTFNPWSLVTVLTALLLIPVMVEVSSGSNWQFTGFLCPALILFVGLTPDYGHNDLANKVHCICAAVGALFSIVYILAVATHLWWLILVYVVAAAALTLYFGKSYWCFFFEMAAYLGIYTAVFVMIWAK